MPEIDLGAVSECKARLTAMVEEIYGNIHPVIFTIRCIDPRHNGRTIISVTRQHFLEDLFGTSPIQELIDAFVLKNFNIAANEVIKNFDLTSLGGRYSLELPRVLGFLYSEGVRRTHQLYRIYATDHEADQCLAEAYNNRRGWDEALIQILNDLSTVNFPNQVDIYTGQVRTRNSRPSGIDLAANYYPPGSALTSSIIRLPG